MRIAATECFLGTWFFSGIYVSIPCIKEIPRIIIIIMIIIIIITTIQMQKSLIFGTCSIVRNF
jgi:hypothetical protein